MNETSRTVALNNSALFKLAIVKNDLLPKFWDLKRSMVAAIRSTWPSPNNDRTHSPTASASACYEQLKKTASILESSVKT
jgi:hypothetical protein